VIGHAQGQGVFVSALGVLAGYYGLVGERMNSNVAVVT